MTEPTSPVASLSDEPLTLDDITCPITQDIFIEPYKTNCCEHRVEKLALAKLLREDNRCPVCRAVITSAALDEALVQKIQDQFIKVHGDINADNKKLFDEQKQSLDTDPIYASVRGRSVIPEIRVARREPVMSWGEIFRRLGETFRAEAPHPLPRAEGPDIAPRYEGPYSQVIDCINNDNLDLAERTTDRMAYRRNECYKKIVEAYLIKADSDVSNIQRYLDKAILVSDKISMSIIKNDLFSRISFKYLKNKKFSKAFQTVKKIDSFVFRFISRIVICAGIINHGFILAIKAVLLPFRVLFARIRY